MPNPRPWPAKWPGSGLVKHKRPVMERHPLESSASFQAGDFVKKDGSDEIIALSGNDPTPILGLAAEDSANVVEPGFTIVYIADDDLIFAIKGSVVPVVATHVGNSYGFLVDADGIHIVDISDTSNTRFNVDSVDVDRELYFVKLLTAHQQ